MSTGQIEMESSGRRVRCPVQEQRARWERKRACTARELLETERRYQEQLGLVATVRARHALRSGTGTPGCGRVPARSVTRSMRVLELSACIWGLRRLLQFLAARWPFQQTVYRCSLLPQYFVGILRAKGTLRPPERQALFGPWELIYSASQ